MHPSKSIVAISLAALAGCQGTGNTAGLTDADRSSISRASEDWFAAATVRRHDVLASLYAEDAILLPPNANAVSGRAAIKAYFDSGPPFSSLQHERKEVVGNGDLAYARGTFAMNFGPADAATTLRGKYIEIWRRQTDGSWKISRDIYNADPN